MDFTKHDGTTQIEKAIGAVTELTRPYVVASVKMSSLAPLLR